MHPKYVDLLDTAYLEYARMVDETEKQFPTATLEQRRTSYLQSILPLQTDNGIISKDSLVQSRDGYSIPVRTFASVKSQHSTALTIYLHGGGWILGNLDSHHDICCDICNRTNSNVLAVDYRLAPEYPFPIPLYDCIDVIKAAIDSDNIIQLQNITSVVLSGDSAGANLSAASILSGELDLKKLSGQVLIYAGLGSSTDASSFSEHADAPILPAASLREFFLNYLGHDETKINYLTSPLMARDLSAMPTTYLSAAANDPLRDDSIAFHEKLISQGIHSTLQIEEKLGHGYLRVRNQGEHAIEAFKNICSAIKIMHDSAINN